MDIGLLWFDNDKKRDLPTKVQRAAEHYQNKFGYLPDVCFVHPSQLPENGNDVKSGLIMVKPSHTVLRHHFWLGQAE